MNLRSLLKDALEEVMLSSNHLDFILGEALFGAIIKLRRPWTFLSCHFLSMLSAQPSERYAVMPDARKL